MGNRCGHINSDSSSTADNGVSSRMGDEKYEQMEGEKIACGD